MRATLDGLSRTRQRWKGSRALVPIPSHECPACGAEVTVEHVGEPPLFRHGGYGAMRATTTRTCRCGWRCVTEVAEVRP